MPIFSEWTDRPIFVSSTFRDFHAERDYLRQVVFPELAERLRERRQYLVPVDLRWGVDTSLAEKDSETHILQVCLDEVRRSAPFMIVLLGDRFGHVPDAEALRRAGVSSSASPACSVTALEIERGVLDNDAPCRHTWFYFREPLPYDDPGQMTQAATEVYRDDPRSSTAACLTRLKARIRTRIPDRVRTYQADWSTEDQRVTGLEEFGRMVIEDLWSDLDRHTQEGLTRGSGNWLEKEDAGQADYVARYARDFCGRDTFAATLLSAALGEGGDNCSPGVLISGEPGIGKSGLYAHLVGRLRNAEGEKTPLVLYHSTGASGRAANVSDLVRRWSGQLVAELGEPGPLSDANSLDACVRGFQDLLARASARCRVVVLLDGAEQLTGGTASAGSWLLNGLPARVWVLATAGPWTRPPGAWEGLSWLHLPPLTTTEAAAATEARCRRERRQLPAIALRALLDRTGPHGAAAGNPLWLELAIGRLIDLDADDFGRLTLPKYAELDDGQRLAQLLTDIVSELPADIAGLYQVFLARIEKLPDLDPAWGRLFAMFTAIARQGWRESDLVELLAKGPRSMFVPPPPGEELSHRMQADIMAGESVSPVPDLAFARVRRAFGAHLARRGEDWQYVFAHLSMREAVARRYFNFVPAHQHVGEIEMEEGLAALNLQANAGLRRDLLEKNLVPGKKVTSLHALAGNHLFGLPVQDTLRQAELMHHCLHGQHKLPFGGLIMLPEVYYASITDAAERRQATRTLAEFAAGDCAASEGYNQAVLSRVLRMLRTKDFGTRIRVAELFEKELIAELAQILEVPRRETVIQAIANASREILDDSFSKATKAFAQGHQAHVEGDVTRARHCYEQALKLFEADPNNVAEDRMLLHSIAHAQVGHCLAAEGRFHGAVAAYRLYASLLERRYAEFPESKRGQRDLGIAQAVLGEALANAGNIEEAKTCLLRAVRLLNQASGVPADPTVRRDIWTACLRTGRLLLSFGERGEAAQALLQFLTLTEDYQTPNSGDVGLVVDAAKSWEQLGAIAVTDGESDKAVKYYHASVTLWESALEHGPEARAVCDGLSTSLNVLAQLNRAGGDTERAKALFERRLRLLKGVLAHSPNDLKVLRALAFTHKRLGELALDRGDRAAAIAEHYHYRDGLAVCARTAPADRYAACDAALATYFVGHLLRNLEEPQQAWALYQDAVAAFFSIAQTEPGLPNDGELLTNIIEALNSIATFAQAHGLDQYAEACLRLGQAIQRGLG